MLSATARGRYWEKMRNFPRTCAVAFVVVAPLLSAEEARAAPPADWCIAIERVFGIVRTKEDIEFEGGADATRETTSVSLGSRVTGLLGYSPARFAVDYLASSGLTVGGSLGYEHISAGDEDEDGSDWWLLAARVGYLAHLGDGAGIWPRGGLTYTVLDGDGDNDATTATALTLEVPLLIYALGHRVGFEIIPYADIGVGGGGDNFDRTLTEFGLQFGLGTFF